MALRSLSSAFSPLLAGVVLLLAPAAHAEVGPELGWHRLPDTTIQSVCAAENGFEQVWGVEGCFAILSWSGAIFDSRRDRMVVTGGGHNAYYGNELYALSLETLAMERITDPGLPPAPFEPCEEAVAGGSQPNSRHTYDGIEYIEHADSMYVFSGSLACGVGTFGSATWTFDFERSTWARMDPTNGPDYPTGEAGMMTGYHPEHDLIYLHDRLHLYTYDVGSNAYTRLTQEQSYSIGYHHVGVVDPARDLFVIVGYSGLFETGRVFAYDIGPGSDYALQELTTIGGGTVVGDTYPGVAYDPVSDRLVAWVAGSSVHSLDLDTLEWTEHDFAGPDVPGPVSQSGYGTHGRWRYSAQQGYFVLVNEYDEDAWALRFQPDAGMPPGGETDTGSGDTGPGDATGSGSATDGPGGSDAGPGAESGVTSSATGPADPHESGASGCGCASIRRRRAWAVSLLPLLICIVARRRLAGI